MKRAPTAPEFLLLPEAADLARAPMSSLRSWIADGRLRAYKPGRRVLVRRDDLLALIESSATITVGDGSRGGGR